MTGKTRLTLNIDDDIAEELKKTAKENYITPTALARKIISEYFRNKPNDMKLNVTHNISTEESDVKNAMENLDNVHSSNTNEKNIETNSNKADNPWSSNIPKIQF